MKNKPLTYWALLGVTITAALLGLAYTPAPARADDSLDEEQEKAIKAAVKLVAPSVVKIETSGGLEVVRAGRANVRRGTGPTTGVIVREDGYVISSSFNFANKPSTIRVSIPGTNERRVARVVATDETRMLTLLKVNLPAGTKLPVPKPMPKKDMEIGLTAIAVGRTLAGDDPLPSVSVGIISAVDRIWGKAIQTDAKVSPTNYGGPLIDLEGRVQGVLVPASPQAEGELAGFEWYDSGIGFAIPLEDINAVLPRMIKGTEKAPVVLKRGVLGIIPRSTDEYEALPIIGTVAPGSAAEKAGIKPGDLIKMIDGKPVNNFAQVKHRLNSKYEGDDVALVLERDKKEVKLDKVAMGGGEQAFPQAFLGVLPVRDDPDKGVEVRFVLPDSPAAKAGIKDGDRLMKVSSPIFPTAPLAEITRGRNQLMDVMMLARPGQEMKFEVKAKADGKAKTVTVKLAELPDSVPAKLPDRATAKKALTPFGGQPPKEKPKPDADGLMKKQTPAKDHTYYLYVPDDYDPDIAYALVVWFHPLGKNKEKDFEDFSAAWEKICSEHNVILLMPQSDSPRGWTPNETEFVNQAIRTVLDEYTIDRRRVIAHGMGIGGEMALHVGFRSRGTIRGVATVGAHLGADPREKVLNQPLAFYLAVGQKDPLLPAVKESKEKLAKFKYVAVLREVPNMGHEYIDGRQGVAALEEMVRWIDSLDWI